MSTYSLNEIAPPWRERAFVSLAEAAAIAGRSYTWARNRTVDGALEVRRPTKSGPTLVTVVSLVGLIDAAPAKGSRCLSARRSPYLTLVINNDAK